MNVHLKSRIAAAAALIVIGSSAAAFETRGEQAPGKSTRTRAEVNAEWVRAQRAGEIARNAGSFKLTSAPVAESRTKGPSRKQVMAETLRALNDGSYVNTNEAWGTVVPGSGLPAQEAEPRVEARSDRDEAVRSAN